MLVQLILAGALLVPVHPPELRRECICDEIRLQNGWCNHCKVGYIAGLKTASYLLVEDLDTHGHEVDVASLECAACRKAAAENGICERCGWGIHNGKIYGSRMTYYLAKATRHDPATITCPACKQHAAGSGWCEGCARGWVAHFAYTDRATFDAAAKEYRLLKLAVETAPRCETCASARYYGSICPKCNITYRDGEPVGGASAGEPKD